MTKKRDVLHGGRVDEQVEQEHFDDDSEHGDQVGDPVLEDGHAPGGAHEQVEHLPPGNGEIYF
jgi:hypothetical protein